jgi:hypothetical protein
MPYICKFEPIPSIVKAGTNFPTFGSGGATGATEGPPHKTAIYRGKDLIIGGDRAPFDALYL